MRTHIYKKGTDTSFQSKTPITEDTFERQGWDKHIEKDNGSEFYYFTLALPKDNPDPDCPLLISSLNDESEMLGMMNGNYVIEIADFFGLGVCFTEEDLDRLYFSLTHSHIES